MKDNRDYIGYGIKDFSFEWPNKSKLALQFVLNYEEGAENSVLNGDQSSESFLSEIVNAKPIIGSRHMNMESIYEYGSRRGFWRIHKEFDKRNFPLTIFGVGMALEKNPEVCEQIIKSDYEVASHGYRWIDYQNIDEEIEKEHTILCNNLINEIFGYYPSGWYTGRTSPNTRKIILENTNIIYDSDSYADDLPYWINHNNKKHLVIPYTLDNNDMRFTTTQGFNTGDDFFNYLKNSFDTLYRESVDYNLPKMMSVGLHCRIIGRPGRFLSLVKFLDYVSSFQDIWICKRKDIAEYWYSNFNNES